MLQEPKYSSPYSSRTTHFLDGDDISLYSYADINYLDSGTFSIYGPPLNHSPWYVVVVKSVVFHPRRFSLFH